MKKILKSTLFFLLSAIILLPFYTFASSCQQIGSTTFCDDGTSYQQIGNTTFGSDGTSYQRIGNTTFGSNGTSYQQIGNTTFGSDNTSYQNIGNTTFGSDGSTYQRIGNTTFGTGGGNVYNSCPTNSSYNSSTSKCTCNYGYSVNSSKTSCIYTGTYTAPTTPSCPLNSYYDGVSSCKCNYGYTVSGGSCVTLTQSCQNQYGYGSYGSGSSCYCSIGYQWNSSKTSCVVIPTQPSSTSITTPPPSTVGSCSNFGSGAEVHGNLCYCSTGYQWNTALNSCVIGYPTFKRFLTIGSTGTEVVNLKNLLAIKGFYTGYVSTAFDKATATAVSLYQALHNISPDGKVGPLTRTALNKSIISGSY